MIQWPESETTPPVTSLATNRSSSAIPEPNNFSAPTASTGMGSLPRAVELVCSGSDVNLASEAGIGLRAHRTLEQERRARKPIDTLIVTSGWNPIDQLDETAITWIRMRSQTVRRVCSICVGAFALAEAGLLEGRRATTHWRMARLLADRYPKVQVEDARLEAVCRALELGGQSTEEIARRCGYHSVDVLRKAFTRRLGVSPKEYARRFATHSELS